jgi:murein DD-endopeptidase MepM/ murein hydrolase activator NlpD
MLRRILFATGGATGPHLHMGTRWDGASLDPTKLFALTLPESGAKISEHHVVHPAR